jgi:hypothetical protein
MPDSTENKRKLLAVELQRYFGETCSALTARWEAVIVSLVPPVLRELAGRLQAFETLTTQVKRGTHYCSSRNGRKRRVGRAAAGSRARFTRASQRCCRGNNGETGRATEGIVTYRIRLG